MSYSIPVKYEGSLSYNIEIKNDFSALSEHLTRLGYGSDVKIMIVSDTNVSSVYLDEVTSLLRSFYDHVSDFVFEAGEANKHLDTVASIYEKLISEHFERRDLLIALGGGVVGDITGFCAATYLRGIDFIQMPTSLLSQVDSSIGGKTGVDCRGYKNMVGAFYMPKLVYINISTLSTLPADQYSAGMGEIVKHGLIKDKEYFNFLIDHHNDIKSLKFETVEEMIAKSCMIKRNVVENDPKEKGERALLNFGHTIGHAVEKLSGFKLLHGECVAVGIVAASYISFKNGYISQADLDTIENSLKLFDLPVRIQKTDFDSKTILQTTKSDKKMENNKVKFVLLKTIGDAFIDKTLDDSTLLDAIEYITEE